MVYKINTHTHTHTHELNSIVELHIHNGMSNMRRYCIIASRTTQLKSTATRSLTLTQTQSQIWLLHIKLCKSFNPPNVNNEQKICISVTRAPSLNGEPEMDIGVQLIVFIVRSYSHFRIARAYHYQRNPDIYTFFSLYSIMSNKLRKECRLRSINLYKNGVINECNGIVNFKWSNKTVAQSNCIQFLIWLRNSQSIGVRISAR